MKQFLQCFLFRSAPDNDWARGKRLGYWAWNWGILLLSGIGLGLVSLFLAPGPYALRLILGYIEKPLILCLNLLPVLALLVLLYGLIGRAWIAFLVTGGLVLGLSLGNYYKLMFRNDPVLFSDLLLLKEAGTMASRYQPFLDWKVALSILCVLFGTLFLFFLVRGRPFRPQRIALSLAGALLAVAITPTILDAGTYNVKAVNYSRLDNIWSATQQFVSRGFLYPFLHSISDAVETPPEGYSKDRAETLLAPYSDADIPDAQKINIVGIMLEAYSDFSQLGVPQFATDIYEVWHQLEAEGYSGTLIDNIFAGGTVDTERSFLTGYSQLPTFRSLTNSYAWYFRTQGYRTEGMHPCYDWFYNRRNINENVGFQEYYFIENYFGELTGGGVAADYIFIPELIKTYKAATAQGGPYFHFSVSYQGHGPYDSTTRWWGERGQFVVNNGEYTEEQYTILENYFGSIYDTNQRLKTLTDYFRADDKPVILLLFGDHKPWMGDGNTVYQAMGVNFDLSTQDGFFNYYATSYLIWANDAAKAALGRDFTGTGPTISPCFLMNELFRLCGWDGPAFMQASQDVMDRVPVQNNPTGLFMEDGVLTNTLSSESKSLVEDFRIMQYYDRKHFRYSAAK